jgi:hypothetical protein
LTAEPNNSGGGGYEEDFVYIVQQNSGNPDLLATFWNDVPNDGYGVIPPIFGVVEVGPAVPTPVIHGTQVCWQTVAGHVYQAEWKPANSRGSWRNLGPIVEGTGGIACVSGHPPVGNKQLYRIVIVE